MAKLSSAVWAAQAIAPIAVLAMPARIGGVFRRREPTLQERLEPPLGRERGAQGRHRRGRVAAGYATCPGPVGDR